MDLMIKNVDLALVNQLEKLGIEFERIESKTENYEINAQDTEKLQKILKDLSLNKTKLLNENELKQELLKRNINW